MHVHVVCVVAIYCVHDIHTCGTPSYMTHTDVLPVCILHVHYMYTRVVCIYIHYMRKSYMWPHIILYYMKSMMLPPVHNCIHMHNI